MRDYGKVYTSFWGSRSVRKLSEHGRTLALYLLTCSHGTIAGVYRLPDGYACEDLNEEALGWGSERVKKGFVELLADGFANRCDLTKWVWVIDHFEWNALENPNQRKAARKVADSIPDECCWKAEFLTKCGPIMGMTAEEIANGLRTVRERSPNQDQDQKQYQEQEQEQEHTHVLKGARSKSKSEGDASKHSADGTDTPNRAKALDSVSTSSGVAPAQVSGPARALDPVQEHAQFERVMAAYPTFSGAPQLVLVEKACRQRVEEGATWDELVDAAERFAKFVKAGGRSGQQYVDTPLKFFANGLWREEWKPPKTKGEQRQQENVEESRAWLREQEGKDAAH